MKRKLNRLLALLLCALMLSSDLTGLITPAQAAPALTDPAPAGEDKEFRNPVNGRPNLFVDFLGDNANYVYTANGAHSGKNGAGGALSLRTATSLDTVSVPAPYDQSKHLNPTGPGNTWAQYLTTDANAQAAPGTVFWVGVGVDRVQLLQLLKSGEGLTSLEAGFYYDSKVIEPYVDNTLSTDPDEAYRLTIQKANINNPNYPANTQWSSDYTVLRAERELDPPKTEPVTREELTTPTIDDILNNTLYSAAGQSDWKMTYVSLELSDIQKAANARRLDGNVYTGVDGLPKGVDDEGNVVPITPDSASGDQYVEDGNAASGYDYNYLILIPFRLKAYGTELWTPLRLVRDATHFSIGASTWGVDAYGAWERSTARNPEVTAVAGDASTIGVEGHPDRDLKLLTRFAGDLNLFGAGRVEELEYEALLKIVSGGGSLNRAKLTVDGDPAVWPVWADTNGDVIGGLQSGLGMHLDVHAQDGYEATVTVTYEQVSDSGGAETIFHQYTQILDGPNDDAYTFIMPAFVPAGARRVTVTVTFQYKGGNEFRIYLSEDPQPGDADHAVGNETTIRTNLDATYAVTANTNVINSYDSMVEHPNSSHAGITHPATTPVGFANKDEYVEITVETHADYEAVVRIYDFDQGQFIAAGLTANATGVGGVTPDSTMIPNPDYGTVAGAPATIPGPNYGKITLPNGGTVRFPMGITDLDVEVTYQLGRRHEATLEVDNDDPAATNFDLNVAQLVYDRYDALNAPSKAYSSVVYHDYDGTVSPPNPDNHRAIKDRAAEGLSDKLPWISESQAALSGSLGGDTGRVGKTWNPKDLATSEDPVTGGSTVMALLAGSATKAAFRAGVNGLDFATAPVDDGSASGLVGLRKSTAGELYGDADVSSAAGTIEEPSVVDVLWEIKTRIDADTATGGLADTYLKTVPKSPSDPTAAYTYYDLTTAQLQAYLLEVFEAQEQARVNDRAYRIARQRYLTVYDAYAQVKDIAAYGGLAAPQSPAQGRPIAVSADGVRTYQDADYTGAYITSYNDYLDDYETYLNAVIAASGTGGTTASAPTNYPGATAPAATTVDLPSHADAVNKLKTYGWVNTPVPTDVPNSDLGGTTIETREGRTVWVVMEADSAYEVKSVEVYRRGSAPAYATGALLSAPASVQPVPVPGYQNVYSFTMPDEDCVVRVTYQLRGTRKLNIAIRGAAGLADNLAVIEAYSVADPAAVNPQLNIVTNEGYTGTPLPSGGSYDATNDVYTPDPVEKVFTGSTVTIRAKVADGYVIKSVEATNSDNTAITVSSRTADDPKDGVIYTFVIPEDRTDDVELIITYAPEEEIKNTATIRSTTEGASDNRNQATWYVVNGNTATTPTIIYDVPLGTHLTGHISVAPGYYIKAVTASGPSGNYSYTLDGNGYNAGYGTWATGTNVPLNIYVTMPGEDLVVDVVFAKGPPEPDPVNTLTLIVKDDENDDDDPTKAAPNWAKAVVYDVKPVNGVTATLEQNLPTPGDLPGDVVGKNADKGNGTLTDRKYVEAGKWVRVDFSAHVVMINDPANPGNQIVDVENSYYVSSVAIGPSNLGVALRWEGPTAVSFYMPAGSTSVTVEFSKYPANGRLPDYVLTVRETYTDLNPGGTAISTNQTSFITTAISDTIGRWSGSTTGRGLDWNVNPEDVPPVGTANATGAATAGEEVTMRFNVDEAEWYYQSVVLISNGAAIRLSGPGNVTQVASNGTVKTYEVKFNMPSGPAEFVVNYRKGPKPTVPDYAFTLLLDDPDNALNTTSGKWDENNVEATFQDPTGAAGTHDPLQVGHNLDSMTAVQHIHAGDIVTLNTTVADGYYVEYMIVNPAGLHITPVWQDADTATFVMPTEGVAVVAKVVKGTPKKYTANLILRFDGPMPDGVTMDQIGQGTFVLPDGSGGTVGSRDGYPTQAIFSTTQVPGTTIPYDLYAFDGYYIDRVTVDPATLGVTGSLSGSCGEQGGDFVMPGADVNVNVWFKRGWPDEIPYDLTIKVHDSSVDPDATLNTNDNNYAALRTVTGRADIPAVAAGDKTPVYGGQVKVIDSDDYPRDRDVVIVDVKAQPGFYVSTGSIQITDSQGNPVTWWYVPGGIAFTQPPRAVTVDITFRRGEPDHKHKATLHLIDDLHTDASANSAIVNDSATLSTAAANATPASVNTDNATISNLYHGDALDLSVLPGAGRHVAAVYAVTPGGTMIPIYGYDDTNALTSDLAQFVPGHPGTVDPAATAGTAVKGAFAMPEADVDVYVRFADGAVDPDALAVNLVVSGEEPNDLGKSGSATAHIDDPAITTDMDVAAPGMDSRFTGQGNEVLVTFEPKTADGYDIVKLEVTNNVTGVGVPYSWISVLQDPPTDQLTNTGVWSGNAPVPGITHPTWKPNPQKQIKLTVPAGGVTIHVTYGKVETTPFRAQVVVNDPLAATATAANPSRNNAWLSQKAGADADDALQKKLQYAVPGEWVDLDIYVHPGYRIEYVKVIPQSFGIVPSLPVGTDMGNGVVYYLHDQTTGFVMPNGDCTVYVKFVTDGIPTKNATLVVNGAPQNNNANNATIQSPQTGTRGPVYVNGSPRSVAARPAVDWVTSDYYWDIGTSSVASITVKTVSGVDVPFTQVEDPVNGHGQITFPMSQEDVIVTITYQADPTPKGQQVVLHVIDKDRLRDPSKPAILGDPNADDAMENYGRLTYAGNAAINASAADTGTIAPDAPENTATILVPAGQQVQVTACSDDSPTGLDGNGKVYIESAYVLFEQNGQMIHFNLDPDSLTTPMAGPGYSGFHDESSFVVHPGRNDVYVTLTRVQPTKTEHAAVLMIRSPAADTVSEAGIHADQNVVSWNSADPARRDKVRANDPNDSHAYVTATDGEKITINVEPATGYIVDYIQVTPLGFPLDTDPAYNFTRSGNTFTFDMPHCNVAVTVYLKRGSNQDFDATLHFIQDPACLTKRPPQAADYAKLSWTPSGESTQSIWADENHNGVPAGTTGANAKDWGNIEKIKIKEGSVVTLDVTLDTDAVSGESDVILSAFVIWDGAIVQLTPVYPAGRTLSDGLEGVTESASTGNNALPDATATFLMPMGNVDVYVVVTTDPPPVPWHTAVLVATDHSPTGNNSGLNEGDLWNATTQGPKQVAKSDNVPTIAWLAVPEGESFSVQPRAAAGYTFDPPAVLSCNDGIHNKNMTTSYINPYIYTEPMGTCNKVVRIDFESNDDLELTVEIEDPDNPSDGTVEQVVTVDPAGTTPPTLRLTSTSVTGSYQIITGITAGGLVELDVQPHPGYQAYAQLFTHDGAVTNIPLSDANGDGIWEGSFPMPANNARVVVTFYEGYKGTLTLINRIASDFTGQATMSEDKRGLTPLTVTSLSTTDSFTSLPNGTALDAQVISSTAGKKVTGLLTVNSSTTLMTPTPGTAAGDPDHYRHTIDRADAEITLVLDEDTSTRYIAAVTTVNKPASAAAPTIADTTDAAQTTGNIWTTAGSGDSVTVHASVPQGYRVDVKAVRTDTGAAVTIAPTALTADGDSVFTMPAANVQVTLTYVKVEFDLTLKIVDTSGVATNATNLTATSNVVSGGSTLTLDGQSMVVRQGASIDLSATPVNTPAADDPRVVGIYYQTSGGNTVWLQSTALGAGVAYSQTGAFTMPNADTTVTVIYDKTYVTEPDESYYIASVEVVDPDDRPGNRAVSLHNTTTNGLPSSSPDWAAGYPADGMTVSYQAEQGYYVTVTARRLDTGASIPVLQMGSATNGTASVTMPAANVRITITYSKTPPEQKADVALQLIKHGAEAGNKASTTNFTDPPALTGLATNGTSPLAPHVPAYTDPTDPVETIKSSATVGDDLRTLANWADSYQVVRMTVAVRKVERDGDGNVISISETPEVELLTSKYAGAATSRAIMPPTGTDEEAVIRVYYGNIYNATFHLVGEDLTDTHTAIDVEKASGNTLGYTNAMDSGNNPIGKPISNDLDRFEGYQGNGTEDIRTTAIPGPGRRLVDVVWESDLTGAASAASAADGTADRYDFTMPAADVDFYAFFEPDDPDNRYYVAKVAFAADSAHQGNSQNAVSIANASDTGAPGGKYWVRAKGGDEVEVTVKVAPGYQAEIITTKIDDSTKLGNLPKIDDGGTLRAPTAADDYQYYITRTAFVPNLTAGKTATFTMPLDTDATVTVRYTKGYDLELVVKDVSKMADDTASPAQANEARVATSETPNRTLKGTSTKPDGSVINYTPSPAVLKEVNGNVTVTTNVTAATKDGKTALYKVFRATAFTGTTRVDTPSATHPYTYAMPSADTVETVLFYNDETPLLAKVELKGESDINGNTATPIIDHDDTTSPDGGTTPAADKTATGAVWTTTYLDDDGAGNLSGHAIDLTLTVAKGYIAKIKVRRDNDNYYNNPTDETKWDYLDAVDYTFTHVVTTADGVDENPMATSAGIDEVQMGYQTGYLLASAFPDAISGQQHFRFIMPDHDADGTSAATDVTVIVEFVRSTDIPQPFDPRNDETKTPSFLDQGFIYGENRGDYAIVEIPTLAMDESDTVKKLYDTDNYDKPTGSAAKDATKDVVFEFYLRTVDKDGNETYTRLDQDVDITLTPYDPDGLRTAGDPYNYYKGAKEGMWTGPETWKDTTAGATQYDFVGSKFILTPTEPNATTKKRTAGAQAVYDMLNNKGSLETYTDADGKTQYRTQIFVMAQDAVGRESAYTQVWIRPWFALGVKVTSYAPTHKLEGRLYKLMDEHELNVKNGYWDEDENVSATTTLTGPEIPAWDNPQHYKWDDDDKPDLVDSIVMEDDASGKWLQILTIRSSELLGSYDKDYDPKEDATATPAKTLLDNVKPGENLSYALELKKVSNLTYTRVNIDLNPNSAVYTDPGATPLSDYYRNGDYKTRTFMLQDTIQLIAGDVDGNGKTKVQDYDTIYAYVYRSKPWSQLAAEPTAPADTVPAGDPAWTTYNQAMDEWKISVYNPFSMAYRCDLDGNGRLTVADLNIVNTRFNYNRDTTHYKWYWLSGPNAGEGTWPFGLGPRDTGNYDALFALRSVEEGEIFADLYWDDNVDPATTLAVPMETILVDEDGNFSFGLEQPEIAPSVSTDGPANTHGERLEIPLGEEALDRTPAGLPGMEEEFVELPGSEELEETEEMIPAMEPVSEEEEAPAVEEAP